MMLARRLVLVAYAVVVVMLTAALAAFLVHVQDAAGHRLRQDFDKRAVLVARLTSDILSDSGTVNQDAAQQQFSGTANEVQAALDAQSADDPTQQYVLRPDGTVIASMPANAPLPSGTLDRPEIRSAARGRMGLSDLFHSADGEKVMLAVPFTTPGGPRIWYSEADITPVSKLATPYLSSALGVTGARACLIDGEGRLVASSTGDPIGTPMPGTDASVALVGDRSTTVGADHVISIAVTGASWRVVFTAPTAALLEPVRLTARAAWELFAAFVLAMLLVLGASALALSRSARLAHERLHDALTGLPNRALFLDRTNQALGARRRGRVATLFIDLDRFKPVNDEYGHAVGDALLRATAERMVASVRAQDVVSRFGGDEFLVLCDRLKDDEQPLRVAHRIRLAMEEPFQIEGHELSLGCSIGVAVQPVDGPVVDAQTLVHQADLAMYRAKTAGRGRIESCDTRPLAGAH